MPLYDVMCPDCRRTWEMLLKHHEHPGTCPHCTGHPDLHRQPSRPAGFILKGEGFYKPSNNERDTRND